MSALGLSETVVESPVGPIRLVADAAALRGVYFAGHVHPGLAGDASGDAHPVLQQAAAELREYFAGTRKAFSTPLYPQGTPFQLSVWRELLRIPYGEQRSYLDLATALGQPTACRAVGAANGRNPLSIFVPCHRVTGADGSMTGFGGGIAVKRWLLDHEQAVLGHSIFGTTAPPIG